MPPENQSKSITRPATTVGAILFTAYVLYRLFPPLIAVAFWIIGLVVCVFCGYYYITSRGTNGYY